MNRCAERRVMREALAALRKDTLVYGFGQALGRGVQFLLVPILTRLLAPGVYGVSDLVLAYTQFVVLVLVFGTDAALVRFFYEEPDRGARRRMISTSLVFRLVIGAALAAVFTLAAGSIAHHFLGSPAYRKYVWIGALTLPWSLIVLFGNDVLRVTFQKWKFIALNLAQAVVTFALSWYLVAGRGLGVAGILYGKLAGDACAALLALVLIRLNITPRLNLAALSRMLSFGAPLVPASMMYGVISAADRFALQHYRPLAEVGVYAVSVKFFALVMLGVQAFSLAFFPFAHARAASADAPRIYAVVLGRYLTLASLAAAAAGLFAPEVLAMLVPAAYRGAAGPAALLTFAAVAYGAYYVACLGVQRALRTGLLVWTAIAGAAAAVFGNVVLTPRFGPLGAAAATLAGNAILALTTFAVAQRVHPLPYRGGRLAALAALTLAAALAGQRWIAPGPAGTALKLGVLLGLAGVAAALDTWQGRADRAQSAEV
jgi:O-antigen/teichoic acid export membrane protein